MAPNADEAKIFFENLEKMGHNVERLVRTAAYDDDYFRYPFHQPVSMATFSKKLDRFT